jgi:hypothetical protein
MGCYKLVMGGIGGMRRACENGGSLMAWERDREREEERC